MKLNTNLTKQKKNANKKGALTELYIYTKIKC